MLRRLSQRSGRLRALTALEPLPITRTRLLATSSDDKDQKKPSRWQQIKTTIREHGPVFVGYYATTYAAGFGICWTAVTATGLDGVALLQQLGIDSYIDTSVLSTRVINALIAAEINEMFDLVRLPFVIATTPSLSRRLGRGSAASKKVQKEQKRAPGSHVRQKGG